MIITTGNNGPLSEVAIEISGLSSTDAQRVLKLVHGIMFGDNIESDVAPESMDRLINVPARVAQGIHEHLASNTLVPNKIMDIKFVRTISRVGLKAAKDWLEQYFEYVAYYDDAVGDRRLRRSLRNAYSD